MHLSPEENVNLAVRISRNGESIFTKKAFAPLEKIFEVTGTFITFGEDEEAGKTTRSNTLRYDKKLFLSPAGRIGDFLNHSCDPNVKVVKQGDKLYIYAYKALRDNEEVLIDYSTIIAQDDTWEMECNCGSGRCRQRIGRFKDLPEKVREEYVTSGVVPSYIPEIG
jgi:hypothetical protein